MSHVYQIHVDTGSASLVNPAGQATVTKVGGNPFQCTVILGNRHRRIRSLALKNAQVPVGFYNVRAPYNTMNVTSVVYTLTPGNYSVTTLLNALNTTVTSAVGAVSQGALNNNIQFSSAAGVATMNVQPLSLLSFLGFSDGQQGTAFYGAESTMTAILGRMAAYSGKELEWNAALNSKIALVPDVTDFNAEAPVKPGPDGYYQKAVPGKTAVL
jgi:hypothetical protein